MFDVNVKLWKVMFECYEYARDMKCRAICGAIFRVVSVLYGAFEFTLTGV